MRAWTSYWFGPAPLIDLAVVRLIVVGTQLALLLFYKNYELARLHDFAQLPDEFYNPLPILRLIIWPFGWDFRPSFEVLQGVYYAAVVSGALALIGLRTNLSLLAFTLTNVFIIGHFYSYFDFHHTEAPLVIALALLTLSPCGRLLSVDDWLEQRKGPGAGLSLARLSAAQSCYARWPLLTVQWLFVVIYLSALLSKLVFMGGPEWVNGYTLQYYLIMEHLRRDIPLALWFAQYHELVLLAQISVVVFQATFVLAVIYPRLKWIYLPVGMGFHLANLILLKAHFYEWMALYAVFVPWHLVLERLRTRRAMTQAPLAAPERA